MAKNYIDNEIYPNQDELVKIKRYEQECVTILDKRVSKKLLGNYQFKERFFPAYLVDQFLMNGGKQVSVSMT